MPEPLPEYRLTARNTAARSENQIHDDACARRYGFPGGLVPGVTIYAYLTHPLVRTLGAAWLERGTAEVRFVRPVLDGEELAITGHIEERSAHGLRASVTARTAERECATLTATLPAGLPTPVNLAVYRKAPLPEERPPATRAELESVDALGTPVAAYDEALASEYLSNVSDDLTLYRGPAARVHPGFYLDQSNRALDRNVRMGPWIHVSSVVRHLSSARVGDTLETRGRVRSLYERNGRDYVELDLVIAAGDRPRAVAHVRHTAIYRLPAAEPSPSQRGGSEWI